MPCCFLYVRCVFLLIYKRKFTRLSLTWFLENGEISNEVNCTDNEINVNLTELEIGFTLSRKFFLQNAQKKLLQSKFSHWKDFKKDVIVSIKNTIFENFLRFMAEHTCFSSPSSTISLKLELRKINENSKSSTFLLEDQNVLFLIHGVKYNSRFCNCINLEINSADSALKMHHFFPLHRLPAA